MPSKVFMICNSYESGFGHGLANDGLDLSKTPHGDPEHGEAYQIGYEAGQEALAVKRQAPKSGRPLFTAGLGGFFNGGYMFWNLAVSEGVKLIAKQMIENPHDWKQGAYHFQNVTNRDLNIWTANGVSFIRMEGGDVFTPTEKRYLMNAIKKSIAMRLLTPNV